MGRSCSPPYFPFLPSLNAIISERDLMPEPLYTHHGGASDSTVSLPSPSDTSSEPRHNSSPIHAYEHVPEHEDDLQSQASPPLSPTDRQPHAAVLATTADKAASTHRNEKSSPTTAAKRVLASVKRIISNEKVGDEQMARSLNGMRYHKANSIVLDVVLCLLPIAFVGQYVCLIQSPTLTAYSDRYTRFVTA